MMDLSPLKSITFLNRAMALIKLHKIDEAREYNFKALRLLKLLNDELGLAEYYKIMGVIESMDDNKKESVDYFNKALKIFKRFENLLGYAETLLEMGLSEINSGNKNGLLKIHEAEKLFVRLKANKKATYAKSKIDEYSEEIVI